MHRIAQIGAGRMGSGQLRNAARNPRLDLALLVDPRPDAGEIAGSVGAKVASLDQVLADPGIEGIIVADILAGVARPGAAYAVSVQSMTLAEAAARSVATGAPVRL